MGETTTEAQRAVEFVRAAKSKGASDSTITLMLREGGWSERKIQAALAAYAQDQLGLTAPARGGRSEGAREAFFYLINFALLATWAIALIWLADGLIDRLVPDPLAYHPTGAEFRANVADQLACVIVAFPLFLWVNVLLSREIAARPETLDSGVRKWLTYVALAITAGTLVGDATIFLSRFLSGGLTVSFGVKVLVLLLVAAGIFWYYLDTIRATTLDSQLNRAFAGAATAIVAIALVLAFWQTGSPSHERGESADLLRIQSLTTVADAIYDATPTHRPPRSLTSLRLDPAVLADPITQQKYSYTQTSETTYALCATFDNEAWSKANDSNWLHPRGYWCFHIASPKRYPQG